MNSLVSRKQLQFEEASAQKQAGITKASVLQAGSMFVFSLIEAVCVFFVITAKAGLVLLSASIAAGAWASVVHKDIIRIPLLLVASVGSIVNLYLLWNAHVLRRSPSAVWRKRELPRRERLRIIAILVLSVATLVLASIEVYLHRLLHHSMV